MKCRNIFANVASILLKSKHRNEELIFHANCAIVDRATDKIGQDITNRNHISLIVLLPQFLCFKDQYNFFLLNDFPRKYLLPQNLLA